MAIWYQLYQFYSKTEVLDCLNRHQGQRRLNHLLLLFTWIKMRFKLLEISLLALISSCFAQKYVCSDGTTTLKKVFDPYSPLCDKQVNCAWIDLYPQSCPRLSGQAAIDEYFLGRHHRTWNFFSSLKLAFSITPWSYFLLNIFKIFLRKIDISTFIGF